MNGIHYNYKECVNCDSWRMARVNCKQYKCELEGHKNMDIILQIKEELKVEKWQVEAAVKFAESKPGRVALITLLEKAKDGINGKTGTRIHA